MDNSENKVKLTDLSALDNDLEGVTTLFRLRDRTVSAGCFGSGVDDAGGGVIGVIGDGVQWCWC